MRKRALQILLFTTILAGLLGGVVGAGLTGKSDTEVALQETAAPEDTTLTNIVEKVSPSIVSVFSLEEQSDQNELTPENMEGGVIGSGFIIVSDLNQTVVLTNKHIVDSHSGNYYVLTQNKEIIPVLTVERSENEDIALLSLPPSALPVIQLGNSDFLKPGQRVIAIGTALGELENTVTFGVISAINREITVSDERGMPVETLKNVLQIDAALNPGNSGGPLLNLSGEVVGINVALTENAENIGFAIPSNAANTFVEQTLAQKSKSSNFLNQLLNLSYF